MKIITVDSNRVLIQDDGDEVSVNDGDTIQYTGIYYKTINDIVEIAEIETTFIGIVETEKYRNSEGIIGIYVKPLYIWNKIREGWNKIVNYNPPVDKYPLYPHLLLVDQATAYPHHFLHGLDTCKNKSLVNFPYISQCFDLGL